MKDEVTLFLADDHTIFREGLKLIIEDVPHYRVIGEAGDGKEALDLMEKLKPDVAVLDISMPVMSGIEVVRYLRKYVPEIKIIILSRHDNEEYVKELLKSGVNGYVLKDDAGEDLLRAVDAVMKNSVFLSPGVATKVVSDYVALEKNLQDDSDNSLFKLLTGREREILKLIAEGKSGSEIAEFLRISPRTVKVHRTNIMKKLDVHKSSELVIYAVKNNIIEI
ncbi:MAG TPA: response regulator transcription factor [Spirochaetota bacterium]|nr:response regulator transcription factor [Spirochaetota bacterium]HPJ35726.1 response regulator transcription factor [Spirochaetota bacterium]